MGTNMKLSVGVGRRVITPELGTILYGYAPGRPAKAVGDDLNVIAAAFRSDTAFSMLICFDVCTCKPELADAIRNAVSQKTGIPFGSIIVNTSHTHSGPVTELRQTGWGDPDLGFMYNIMLPKAVEAADEAVNSMRPALLGVGETESDVAANRREITPDGQIVLGQCPWGLMDRTMTVVSFKDADTDECILNMIHYCAHATASGPNDEITRDWPGPMKDILERETGGITLFLAGSNGETGPRCPNGKTTESYQAAMELGKRAGIDAVRAWRSIKEWRNVPMNVTNGDVVIPYEDLPPYEEAVKNYERLGSVEKLKAEGRFEEVSEFTHWEGVVQEYKNNDIQKNYVFAQTILTIGPVAIVPFQFEMFIEMTLRLRKYSKFSHTLCLSNANGSKAYLPSQDQIIRGGYEIWQFNFHNTYKLVDNADSYMVTENLKLLNKAFELY